MEENEKIWALRALKSLKSAVLDLKRISGNEPALLKARAEIQDALARIANLLNSQ